MPAHSHPLIFRSLCCCFRVPSYATGPRIEELAGGDVLASAQLLVPYTTWLRPVILCVVHAPVVVLAERCVTVH
mgnify:CR=1 FL=1